MEPIKNELQDWIGRTSEVEDVVTPRLVASFAATLEPHLATIDPPAAPLGIHWCLAPEIVEMAKLGSDGHAVKANFLPPVSLPRRMWAGSDIKFLAPLKVADHIRRRSTVRDIVQKQGRTGPLCFVTVRHRFESERGVAIEEDHTIVYREAASGLAPAATPAGGAPPKAILQSVTVDPVLLFRYSALTFNGHRIHYDAPYAMSVEHYPGLVIHGPLQATLLLNLAARQGGSCPRRYSFSCLNPATGSQHLQLGAEPGENRGLALWVRDSAGVVTMKAAAEW
jgi:3-methylfumaryl-CoA hydratase